MQTLLRQKSVLLAAQSNRAAHFTQWLPALTRILQLEAFCRMLTRC